jgi:hypothetical protein
MNKSKFSGVARKTGNRKRPWEATIKAHSKEVYLGCYTCEQNAGLAVDIARYAIWGYKYVGRPTGTRGRKPAPPNFPALDPSRLDNTGFEDFLILVGRVRHRVFRAGLAPLDTIDANLREFLSDTRPSVPPIPTKP